MSVVDNRFDYGATRQIAFGFINRRLFVCVCADRGDERRVISLRKANSERLSDMAKRLSKAAREILRKTDWRRVDAMTDVDIARQIGAHAEAARDMAPDIDVRAIREAIGMTQAEFAAAYEFSVRTVQEWERGAKRPSGPARTLLRAIKGDPEGLRKALAAA